MNNVFRQHEKIRKYNNGEYNENFFIMILGPWKKMHEEALR